MTKQPKTAKPVSRTIVPKETEGADRLPKPTAAEYENRQLSLFQTFLANTDEQRDSLSNAIDLWDSVPRYSVSRQAMTKARINDRFLEKHEAGFQYRQRMYTRTIYAARVTDPDGVDRDYYPSATEELVEDALRKLAIDQQAGFFDKPNYRSGVSFTLYALREELQRRGHTRSYQEIVQALNILSQCVVDIRPNDGSSEGMVRSTYLPTLAAVSRNKLREDPKARWMVQFHPLVTGSIDQVTYRQFNYHLMMSHSTQLARWLHKQLALKYTFAHHLKPFDMLYSTVKRDSGLLDEYARGRRGIEKLEAAFRELTARGVLLSYRREDKTGPRGKLLDVEFTLHPHSDFIYDMKASNKRLGDDQKSVGIGGGSSPKPVGIGGGSR
ncbi:hypothetical protein [Granulicella aggregans]|uniref:hypothetical protein n=1 Tax=Granulicella aggregans TaxID=474949 RepID=UPI0021DFE733|nr:hypothetical protein [Granulicella aggregans]